MPRLALSLAAVLILVAGCSKDPDSPPDPSPNLPSQQPANLIDPGPPPQNGLQLILPIHRGIQPGTDNELCTWTDQTAEKDLYIKSVQAFQTVTGHHVVLYKTRAYQPPGTTRKCANDDLLAVQFVAAAGGEGQAMKNVAPGNIAFKIEKGSQLVVNEHFLNASPLTHDVQSAVNMEYVDPSQKFVPAGALALTDSKLQLPPGTSAVDINCTMEKDLKVWMAIPHMHEYGLTITVDHLVKGGDAKRLFDTAWTPEMTFHPPELRADPATPLRFNKGDQLKVHCVWNNTTTADLTFGPEMCVFFAQTVDDQGLGNLGCDRGTWMSF